MYGFKLGSNKELSLAELEILTGKNPIFIVRDTAFFDIEKNEAIKLMNRVGGSSKLIRIVYDDIALQKEAFVDFASDWLDRNIEGKITFGLSYIGEVRWPKAFNVGLELKKAVKNLGRSCRVVTSKNAELSTADILKNGILGKDGAEFSIFQNDKRVYVAITEMVQGLDSWAFRDMNRPGRNAKRGMLPPKLARMMVNLSEIKPVESLLDAFCGSGTVLMEAVLVDVNRIFASDISEEAVEDTKKTMEWVKQNYARDFKADYFVCKAENLSAYLAPESVDVVVSELYLGKPKSGKESRQDILMEINELTEMYKRSLAVLQGILKKGGRIVLALPVSYSENMEYPIAIEAILGDLTIKRKIRYHREDQFVGRDIVVLVK
jgi:tRNA G10  N-methylase Trm11